MMLILPNTLIYFSLSPLLRQQNRQAAGAVCLRKLGSVAGNQGDHLLSKCAAGYRKRQSTWRWLPLSVIANFRRYYHSTDLFAKACYFVLFRLVLSYSLLICPVGCYVLLFVCTGAGVIKRASGGERRWITRYSIAQIFFSNVLKASQLLGGGWRFEATDDCFCNYRRICLTIFDLRGILVDFLL